jgi:hypothetical protein
MEQQSAIASQETVEGVSGLKIFFSIAAPGE